MMPKNSVPMNSRNHQRGSGLSYSSMPSKECPIVLSVMPAGSPLRVAKISQNRATMLPSVSRAMYPLQKLLMFYSWAARTPGCP